MMSLALIVKVAIVWSKILILYFSTLKLTLISNQDAIVSKYIIRIISLFVLSLNLDSVGVHNIFYCLALLYYLSFHHPCLLTLISIHKHINHLSFIIWFTTLLAYQHQKPCLLSIYWIFVVDYWWIDCWLKCIKSFIKLPLILCPTKLMKRGDWRRCVVRVWSRI